MMSPSPLSWSLPLDRTHNGIPLANGVQGLLVWGDTELRVTIGRAGFWDRRGGNPFLSKATYHEVRDLLRAGDEAGLMKVFGKNTSHQDPARPHQIGGGQLVVPLPDGWRVQTAVLEPSAGFIRLVVGDGADEEEITVRQAVDGELAWIHLPMDWPLHAVRLRPSWDWVGEKLRAVGCEPPREWDAGDECGFVQSLPEDDPLAVVATKQSGLLRIATSVGPEAEAAARAALDIDPETAEVTAAEWWRGYWEDVPSIRLPDPVLQEQVEYGLYLQACCTPSQGLPCTLQGPLMECEGIPPWSNDYHFNINLQMIYTPALASNRPEHFEPLWDLLRKWMPGLRKSGAAFFGDADALMLPHAVDDRCQVVGSFWTGSIDHGCTAWMALLCADYCRYTGDDGTLRDLAWPLLKGAWAGYRAMLEEAEDDSLHLPVSVSPEYKGSRMDAWGADSSFQLAALRAVLRTLPRVAAELGEPVDPAWEDARRRTPPFASEVRPHTDEVPEQTRERIVLWRGQDLDGSHRHHSHLAGITPFRTLDPRGEHADILNNSLSWWTRRGPGGWSGWCVPWAAMIHARLGRPDAAVHWLHTWNDVFTNRGRASLHDADFPGVSTLAANPERDSDIMQLDGRFGALSAVLELLVQDWNDEIRVLPGTPRTWTDFEFDGIRAPGGFLVGATVRNRKVKEVRVTSLLGRPLRLRIGTGELRTQDTRSGEELRFHPEI